MANISADTGNLKRPRLGASKKMVRMEGREMVSRRGPFGMNSIAIKAKEIAKAAGAVGGRVLAIGSVTTVQTIAASMSPNSRVAFALIEEKW